MYKKLLLSTAILCCFGGVTQAQAQDALKKALVDDSSHYIHFRYRLENVDQDGFANDATASTLRSTLGYKTGDISGFSGTLEFQNITQLGGDNYNDTINGKTTHPTIADPETTAVNQAFLTYEGFPDTSVSVGRKAFNFDNMRFVNQNNWRQHHQTFDSVSIENHSIDDTALNYVYVANVNRSNGDDHPLGDIDSNLHLLNAKYSGWEYGSVTGYGYFLDFDNTTFSGNSSKTYGLRFTGKAPINENLNALYTAEYAMQSDHGSNTASYDADYHLAELGVGGSNWGAKLGYEVLEGDGTNRFTTPLGTGHGFHGWADRFVSVPTTGIEDKHIKLHYKVVSDNLLNGTKFDARYHDFDAEQGGADHGSEVDLKISKSFWDHYSASIIYADYDADSFSTDTQKAFLILGAKF